MSPQLTDSELHDMYDNMIDECSEPVRIGSLTYTPSDVLRTVDPVAYRCGFNDWLDSQCQDGQLFEHNDEYYTEEQEETEVSA